MFSYLLYYFRHWSTIKYFLDKPFWVIRCTRYWRPTWPLILNFGQLTWISIGITLLPRTIYVPGLKLPRQRILEIYPFRNVWDTNMTFDLYIITWISLGTNIASRTVYLLLLKLLEQTVLRTSWVIFCTMLGCCCCWLWFNFTFSDISAI